MNDFLGALAERRVILGDGGYLIELERRGFVDSGSSRETVGTGKGSGQFTPEVAIEHPAALRGLHEEFLLAGSEVLQALTFFASREKLSRAGYGAATEAINREAVRIARDVAGDDAWVAGTVARSQLFERIGTSAADSARDQFAEQIRLQMDAGIDLLILETFFRLDEMLIALDVARASGLPIIATMSFRPTIHRTANGQSPAACAVAMADAGADLVGANCEQNPARMRHILREMRAVVDVPLAAQPAAFATTDEYQAFTKIPEFPDDLETVQVSRREFRDFGRAALDEGIGFVGGCCGCNAPYVRAMRQGIRDAVEATPAAVPANRA